MPLWMVDSEFQQKKNISVFLYQKLNASQPNFISTNRGTEGGVYLRYIVDHYHNFPDIAIFVHGKPSEHSTNWMDMVNCVSLNATYSNMNDVELCRNTGNW
jgi:hypothetical protein